MSEARKRVAKATGLHSDEIFNLTQRWGPDNPMRRILSAEIDRLIDESRSRLETITVDELPKLQGLLQGLRKAKAVIHETENL